jgi:hypothetical protein
VLFKGTSGSTSTFFLQISDTQANGHGVEIFSTTQTMAVQNLGSAEWIAEAPTLEPSGVVATLPNFGKVTFTGAWATIGSTTGPINSFANLQADDIVQNGVQVTTTSNPPSISNSTGYQEPSQANGRDSSTFTVTYGAVPNGKAQAHAKSVTLLPTSRMAVLPTALQQSPPVMQTPTASAMPTCELAALDAWFATSGRADQDGGMLQGSHESLTDIFDSLFGQDEPAF